MRYRAAAKRINLMTDQLSRVVIGSARLMQIAPELEPELHAFAESGLTMFDYLLAMAKTLEARLDEELAK